MIPNKGTGAHLYAADPHWWHYHEPEVSRNWEGECWSQDTNWEGEYPKLPGINLLQLQRSGGLSMTPGVIHSGGQGSSGYQAVNLALLLGATTILLVGYDMHHRKGLHWFGAHPKEVNRNQSDPQVFAKSYDSINPQAYGVDIINCTPGSAVTAFPFGCLDDY